ncbi:MAG: hypothetical protein QOE76_740 [Frankiales bacterium]|jgi:hypothetical protein|nr:hypothetical protein [Frankiales bacterium]
MRSSTTTPDSLRSTPGWAYGLPAEAVKSEAGINSGRGGGVVSRPPASSAASVS